MSRTTVIVLAVVLVVVAVVVVLVIRRQRYVRDLRSRGWTFDSSPALDWVLDHQAPPFGLGFVRKVDEGVSGRTSAGVGFRVFEYRYTEAGPTFDERLASLELPVALPELFVTAGQPRAGVRGDRLELDPALTVHAADPGYAAAVLSPALRSALAAVGQAGDRVDVSIDGSHLVAVGAPKDPDALQAYLERLATVARAVDPAALAGWATPARPAGFGFYGHPDFVLVGRDDSLIGRYGLTTAGFGHETEKVLRGSNDGLPLDAFVHRWKTQRTETYTDSNGRTQTRTVTDQHSEIVLVVNLPFSWPLLAVGPGFGWGGEKVRFESEQFNDEFTVRTADARFAYDVIHPRTMEFLMATRPPGFRIEGDQLRFAVSKHDTALIGFCADFAHDFLSRVPSYVWKNLQLQPPAFRTTA